MHYIKIPQKNKSLSLSDSKCNDTYFSVITPYNIT